MRGRTVLILLILVIGLVAFIELYEHELPSSDERIVRQKRLLDLDPGKVSAVDRVWGDDRLRLERRPGGQGDREQAGDPDQPTWFLVEPLSAHADDDLVTGLIESLATLEKKRVLQDSKPEEVGLDPPRLVLTLTAGDEQTSLRVGSEVPAGDSMIVSVGEPDEIVVVDNSVWLEMTREAGDWRSRQILEVGPQSVSRMTLERAGQRLVLSRRGPVFWVDSPFSDRADAERVDGLLAALVSMRVVSFADEISDPIPDPAFDPPVGRVEIGTGSTEEVLALEWGGEVPGSDSLHYARARDQIFSTGADLQPYFDSPLPEWRSLELTSMESFQIDGLTVVQHGQETMRLVRDGANWKRNEEEISFPSVSDLLYALTDARAEAVLAESKREWLETGLAAPILEMILEGGDAEEKLAFYARDQETAQAVVDDREVVLSVGKNEFTEILVKTEGVRGASDIKTAADLQFDAGGGDLNPDR